MESPLLRRVFRFLNTFVMVPALRAGLGPFLGNPLTGYVMVMKTVGRRTGKVRHVPINYAILNGQIYGVAGRGQIAHWYRNLKADPNVEVMLPSGPIAGVAEDVTDPDESFRALRQVLKNAGFAGFFLGVNPRTVSDAVLREKAGDLPVIRIRPTGVGSGAADPGGWLWLAVAVAGLCCLLRAAASRRGDRAMG